MEPLAQFDVLVPTFQRLAGRVTPAQLDEPTPCAGWAVRDLFGHLIGGATTFAAVVRGQEPPAPASPSDESLASAAAAAIADVDDAFRGPGAFEQTIATPFGAMPGEAFARYLAFDLLMHTWDLATATGQQLDVPDDVVAAADAFARQIVTPEVRALGVFDDPVEPAPGASPLERLVAFSGRTR